MAIQLLFGVFSESVHSHFFEAAHSALLFIIIIVLDCLSCVVIVAVVVCSVSSARSQLLLTQGLNCTLKVKAWSPITGPLGNSVAFCFHCQNISMTSVFLSSGHTYPLCDNQLFKCLKKSSAYRIPKLPIPATGSPKMLFSKLYWFLSVYQNLGIQIKSRFLSQIFNQIESTERNHLKNQIYLFLYFQRLAQSPTGTRQVFIEYLKTQVE